LELSWSSLSPHRHNLGHFRRGLHSQSLDETHKLNTTWKSKQRKLPWFSCLLWLLARKRDGLIVQRYILNYNYDTWLHIVRVLKIIW